MSATFYLDFEKSIEEIDTQIAELESQQRIESRCSSQLRELRNQRDSALRALYENLNAWQTTLVARHKDRPHSNDLIQLCAEEFVELHGDRRFGDDPAMLTGFGKIDEHRVMFIGHRKGRTSKEKATYNFGCAHPEGYRKALLRMKLAEKYSLPVVCLIDTAGAYPGVAAEQRGQHQAIAENLLQMSRLRTPIVCVVIGEGGSGGALGIGVGDRVGMLEHAYYSVISPEGCAGILWKDKSYAGQAAEALRFRAPDLLEFGVIDNIIREPLGGAHRDYLQTAMRLKMYIKQQIAELNQFSFEELLEHRYRRFRDLGEFNVDDGVAEPAAVSLL